ncbi:MAG TPA: protein kinase [Myxococcaceae bacterium]|nr:protein kinase [Myxococcaceae bacterium]
MKAPVLFGKYLLLERINVGGMAEVFIAKAFGIEGFERVLAVKKILPTMAADAEFITMFIDEARISVQLNHANIVHIHELGKHDDSFYIAMEYVSGPDLRTILDRFRAGNARMPIAQAAFIASKICEGLDYAHRKKDGRGMNLDIIHRDVSPQNVLISYEGEVKIIDFGIAKAANRTHQTQAGILKGKFAYMSPEQVQGRQIDRRSDIFAVGNILFEMLTGERLFVGGSDFSVVEKVRNAEVPSVREIDPEIPTGLEQILYRALAREPTERYQWASEMQEDLLRFQLVGDTIYSSKNLSVFMKEAFAEDLQREHGRMERFTSMQKPAELEPSAVTQSPFAAPPRGGPPALKSGPDARPVARRGPSPHQANVAAANVAAAAMGVEEPSISVDPSIPSFQLPPGDATAVNEKQGATDTFITPEPQKEHRRVGRGEKVEIGAERDDLIDAPTYPRPAYASAKPAQAPVNGKHAREEPPPWPSLEGRGETVIQQGPPPRPPARREGPGRHATPKPSPSPSPGPRSPPMLTEVPVSSTDVNGSAAHPPETGEWAEDPAMSRTVAEMPAVSGAQARGGLGDDALPEPPRPEIPSVTNLEIPRLEPEPKTTAGEEFDTRTNTDSIPIPLPAPERAVTDQAVPLPASAIPLPAPEGPPPPAIAPLLPDIPLPKVSASQAIPLPSPYQDAVTSTDAPSTAPRDIPALEEQSLTPTPTPQDLDPNSDAAALASTALRGVADDDEEPELGPDEKTLARDIPELEEIRRRANAEDEETLGGGGAKTDMRAPQGWSAPEEDTAPPATLGAQHQRNHTPVEGWDEKGGTSAGPITNPGSTTAEMTDEDEPPAWPSLEGRGETFIGELPQPVAPPKKRPGTLRGGAAKGPPAPGSPRPKTGNFVVGRMDDSLPDEPSTSAERPRVLPPGGRSSYGSVSQTPERSSVVTDLPAERSDPELPPYRPSATRGSLVVGPAPIDRRKLLVVGGAAVAALSLVITLAMVFTGSSTEPVWINITPAKASIQVDGQPVKNSEVANLKPGDHELTAIASGFHPLKRRLTVSKRTPPVTDFMASVDGSEPPPPPQAPHVSPPPGPATTTTTTPNVPQTPNKGAPSIPIPPPPPGMATTNPPPGGATTPGGATPAIPKLFIAVFETEEADVEISIGGKAMGKTPGLRLTGMTVGKDYSYVAKKAGFKTAFGKFRSDGQAEINIPLTLEKAAEKEPGVAAVPGTGAPPPPKRLGELACATKPQGAQIFVDGKPTGRTTPATPANPLHVPAGKHKITFKLGAKSVDKMIDVKPGEMERLIIDL